jgi:hypothetical protein
MPDAIVIAGISAIAGLISGIVVAVLSPIASSASTAYFTEWAQERKDRRAARAKLLEDARAALARWQQADLSVLATLVPAIGDERLSAAWGRTITAPRESVNDEITNARQRIGELIHEEA